MRRRTRTRPTERRLPSFQCVCVVDLFIWGGGGGRGALSGERVVKLQKPREKKTGRDEESWWRRRPRARAARSFFSLLSLFLYSPLPARRQGVPPLAARCHKLSGRSAVLSARSGHPGRPPRACWRSARDAHTHTRTHTPAARGLSPPFFGASPAARPPRPTPFPVHAHAVRELRIRATHTTAGLSG